MITWIGGTFSSGAMANASLLRELLAPFFDRIEILYSIRAQQSLIPSFYTECYPLITAADRRFRDVGAWIESTFIDSRDDVRLFDFEALHDEYRRVFGGGRVHLLVFEDLAGDTEAYCSKLAEVLSVDKAMVASNLQKAPHNRTVKTESGSAVEGRRTLGYWITSYVKKPAKALGLEEVAKRIYQTLLPAKLRSMRVGGESKVRSLTPAEIRLSHDQFANSNRRLAAKAGLDQQKMSGYHIFERGYPPLRAFPTDIDEILENPKKPR